MSGSRMRARADVRARPVSLIAVTILVGVIGAIAIAAFAGARQTDSAYERYPDHEPRARGRRAELSQRLFLTPDRPREGREAVERRVFGDLHLRTGEPPGSRRVAPAVLDPGLLLDRDRVARPSGCSACCNRSCSPGACRQAPTRSLSDTRILPEAAGRVPRSATPSCWRCPRRRPPTQGQLFADHAGVVRIPVQVTGWVLGFQEPMGNAPGVWAGPGFSEKWVGNGVDVQRGRVPAPR